MFPTQYKFTDFALDARERTLLKNGEPVKLTSRTFQVLQFLLENAGKVVAKEEFFERIWHGAFVEENNLTVAVAQVRKALGETKETKFIETVPRQGYRFVAAVERIFDEHESAEFARDFEENKAAYRSEIPARFRVEQENPAERTAAQTGRSVFAALASRKVLAFAAFAVIVFLVSAFWRQSVAPAKTEPFRSIAVLPFAAGGDSPDERIFAEKLTAELTYNLGRITDARISAYHAVAAYDAPDIDLEKVKTDLKVDGLITGKLRRDGETFDLKVELNDVRSGGGVWEKRYSLKPAELPESQYRIARDIAQRLGRDKEIGGTFAAANFEAYQAYLAARHHLGKSSTTDYEKAIENFTLAVVKDSSFTDAHSGLAVAHILHGLNLYAERGLSAAGKSFPAARENAQRALLLNPNSDEAFAALAFVNYRHEYDWKRAEDNFRRAVEINPNNITARRWYGELLHKTGRFDDGFAAQRDALALTPNSARILNEMAWGNYLAGRFDEAVSYAEKARHIEKNNAAALYNASEIYECKADYGKAFAAWKEAMTIEAANRKWINNLEESFQKDGYRGFVRAKVQWLENLTEKDYVYPTDLAKGYAALGENDKALEWLEKGVAARVPDILSVKYAPAFNNLRGDARFQRLLEQMNFPQ